METPQYHHQYASGPQSSATEYLDTAHTPGDKNKENPVRNLSGMRGSALSSSHSHRRDQTGLGVAVVPRPLQCCSRAGVCSTETRHSLHSHCTPSYTIHGTILDIKTYLSIGSTKTQSCKLERGSVLGLLEFTDPSPGLLHTVPPPGTLHPLLTISAVIIFPNTAPGPLLLQSVDTAITAPLI